MPPKKKPASAAKSKSPSATKGKSPSAAKARKGPKAPESTPKIEPWPPEVSEESENPIINIPTDPEQNKSLAAQEAKKNNQQSKANKVEEKVDTTKESEERPAIITKTKKTQNTKPAENVEEPTAIKNDSEVVVETSDLKEDEQKTDNSEIPRVIVTDNNDESTDANVEETEPENTVDDANQELVPMDTENNDSETGEKPPGSTLAIDMAPAGPRALDLEPYIRQRPLWPREGQHIMAQYDNDSIVVYQAFKPEIAQYAVENQEFGGQNYSFSRMSWIKTNFLWMMFRSGWATKPNQETILAIRITREGFDEILAKAYSAKYEKAQLQKPTDVEVRLQWDPDHGPNGAPERRRAIQLGLRKETLKKFATEYIVSIEDISELVHEQHQHATVGSIVKLQTPRERVYHVEDNETVNRIELHDWEPTEEQDEQDGFY